MKIDKKLFWDKIHTHYRIVIRNDKDFKHERDFRINILGGIVIFLIILAITTGLSFLIISATPLQRYIPYSPSNMVKEEFVAITAKIDSLSRVIEMNEQYYNSVMAIVSGNDSVQNHTATKPDENNAIINDRIIYPDFADGYFKADNKIVTRKKSNGHVDGHLNFVVPLEGKISNKIDYKEHHYGTDIIPVGSSIVLSVLDGVVLFSGWTVETGNVIVILHGNDVISVYKHNASLLKRENDYVRAGEPIAVAGNSGELTTGPHLHFELWMQNVPVDAREYINF